MEISVTGMRKCLFHSVIILYIVRIIAANSTLIITKCNWTILLVLKSYNVVNGLKMMYG